ncbi:MAG: membrane protein insertion efficiency factor YidD [Propionibacteriaceae bacterium]|jgi:putative membrane protein insertion efficiency factor|nr:membrane protein insertion efficiency factor YidD [Propionibacteriaceae bacterium]
MKWLLIGFIKAWRAIISPWYGNTCKYYPTCSAYGLEAVTVHGAIKGSGLTIWRILRCNPWSTGGYDPVPGTAAALAWQAEKTGTINRVERAGTLGDHSGAIQQGAHACC